VPVLVLAIAIAIIDQGIKYYVQSHMTLGMSIPVFNEVFHITYILPGLLLAYWKIRPHYWWL